MNPQSPQPPEFLANVIHTDALTQGTLLGEFEILGLLGVGGFGMVYGAYDHSLHRTVAIKEYMPSSLASRLVGSALSVRSSDDRSTYCAGLTSFVAEARLLAQFDHPSLVKVYRFWEANNTAYMAMPLYVGMTLKQARTQMSNPPSEAWLRKVLWSVLGALKVLHANNLLHRDVSPDNIFLQNLGPPVLLDLGSARRAVQDANKKHTAVLKVNYAPIEQYADAVDLVQGPWTDLYSLAAVVHGCLCNEPPLPATIRVLEDQMPPIARVAATLREHFGQSYSTEFVAAIGHALAVHPADRSQSVEAFALEMRLSPPGDMLGFDWRAGMATGVTAGLDRPPPESLSTERTILSVVANGAERPARSTAPDASKTPGGRGWWVVMILVGLLLTSGWFVSTRWSRPAAPKLAVPSSEAPHAKVSSLSADPVALCASRSFLTRPLCVHRECQKPQFAQLAVCVEDRQRNARRRDRIDP